MTEKEIYKQAFNDWLSLCGLVNNLPYEQAINNLEELKYDITYSDEELTDINFGVYCFTINNIKGKAIVNEKSIEIWNDEDCCLMDNTASVKDIMERGEIND